MNDTWLLTLIIFLPAFWAGVLLVWPKTKWVTDSFYRWTSLLIVVATCALTFALLMRFLELMPDVGGAATLQARAAATELGEELDLVVRLPWITTNSFHIEYYLGVDGISMALLLLTGIVSVLAMMASFSIEKYVRGYCILFLLLVTGMMGTFLALDFFLFYVFWEVMLLPMYFLIGVWGGPRREYAAIKFFLYTLAGSVLILIAMLGFYFNTNPNTFDIMKLHEIGQDPSGLVFSDTFQLTMFVLLFIGFAIKIPIVPLHTWLPDAHVEAPTPISMILAGVLLKMGGYGLIRIAYPICPAGALAMAFPVAIIGVGSIIYGALAAMAQTDFKKLVAYSSVSHMGYVTVGIAMMGLSIGRPGVANADYYSWGMMGAMYQMIAHGVSSAGMFFLVGVIYERAHHRDLNRFGGLMNIMPVYGAISIIIFFAGMGLPGLCGFFGELCTVLATFYYSPTLGVLAAFGVVLTAAYILWTVQRVFLGANKEYEGTPEIKWWPERLTIFPLIVLAILLGVYPNILLDWMGPDVNYLVQSLTTYVTEKAATTSTAGL